MHPNLSRNTIGTLILTILILTGTLLVASATVRHVRAPTTLPTFSNFEVASNPFTGDPGIGTMCPNTNNNCKNWLGEPAVRADNAGNFYGVAENTCFVNQLPCRGTQAFKSVDNGLHYTTLKPPNSQSVQNRQASPAGGDTDIAVAPVKNLNGYYNVYVASLATTPLLFNIYVSTSRDGGANWQLNPTGADVPVDDREWIAADGANKVCVSYHAVSLTFNIIVNCSYDAGTTFPQANSAFDAANSFHGLAQTAIGNLAIDPDNHVIYQIFSSVANAQEVSLQSTVNCATHVVWMAVSTDGGLTFKDHVVYNDPNVNICHGHQFPNVSIDRMGNVYAFYSDDHNLYYSYSTNYGKTWSQRFQVNQTPSNTAIMPWSSAGSRGGVDVAWYGTSYYDGTTIPDNYPISAEWKVYFAQSVNAISINPTFTQTPATGIIHYGGVCEAGTTCSGNRDLYDDFGLAVSPKTGLASIFYDNDQYTNTVNEPTAPSSRCQSVTNGGNTIYCEHVDVATQTSGTSIIFPPREFEEDEGDFEDIGTNGNHQSDFNDHVENSGGSPITSISVKLNGLALPVTLDRSLPLQSGQSVTVHATSVPVGLVPVVDDTYTVTITVTLADGSTVTHESQAIYTSFARIGL
ncbi:MAG TPA: sialidase family protein [Candidatus Bathyarchaeia archaeon]|nr:sialidase family protein [Candidatus Bathyarchaeia archaeon]